jgi:hypothetical protein
VRDTGWAMSEVDDVLGDLDRDHTLAELDLGD